jgi:hypothetical protein
MNDDAQVPVLRGRPGKAGNMTGCLSAPPWRPLIGADPLRPREQSKAGIMDRSITETLHASGSSGGPAITRRGALREVLRGGRDKTDPSTRPTASSDDLAALTNTVTSGLVGKRVT